MTPQFLGKQQNESSSPKTIQNGGDGELSRVRNKKSPANGADTMTATCGVNKFGQQNKTWQ